MKTVTYSAKKRNVKKEQKQKEEADSALFDLPQIEEKPQEKPDISDLITCQICKDQIVEDHRMCPKWLQIWCYECIRPWLRLKNYNCPNCRKSMKAKQLKKSPLFEKLKDFIKNHNDTVEESPKGSIWEVHKEPDNFFCGECKVLCCSRCALLDEKHKGHTFISLEDIYESQKQSVEKIKEEIGGFRVELAKLLEESNSNNDKSQSNFKITKDLFAKRVKTWEEDFAKKFESQYDTQVHSKKEIEKALSEINSLDIKIADLLNFPHKSKLVKDFKSVTESSSGIMSQKDHIRISRIIDGEDIDNHFAPPYVTKECCVSGISNNSPWDAIIYADEFELNKDKFKLGVKLIQNKKSKSVEISLRITKANIRAKSYESKLYLVDSENQENFIGEFNIELEAHPPSTNMILHTMTMNSK